MKRKLNLGRKISRWIDKHTTELAYTGLALICLFFAIVLPMVH